MIASTSARVDYMCSLKPLRAHWPDVYRGIAILAVVLIHATGHVLSQASPCGWTWYGLACVNRLLQFAVPAFLFVSAFLNAGSLTRMPKLVDYAMRRMQSVLPAFLLASAVGLLFTFEARIDSVPMRHLVKMVAEGKAYYHLYFIVLIAQLYLVLPWLVRRIAPRTKFSRIIIVGIAIQIGIYFVNRWVCPHSSTGRSIFWYVLPVLLGVWFQSRPAATPFLPRFKWPLILTTLGAAAVYLPLAVSSMLGPIDTFAYQISDWAYSCLAAVALCAVAIGLGSTLLSTVLAKLGRRSLGIYLAHPFVIVTLDHVFPRLRQATAPIAIIIYMVAAIISTSTASTALERLRAWRQTAKVRSRPVARSDLRSRSAVTNMKKPTGSMNRWASMGVRK